VEVCVRKWAFKLPLAIDDTTGKPSITLTFPYVSFVLMVVSIIMLLRQNVFYGTICAVLVWLSATILYLMRQITKVKASLSEKSIELENQDDVKS
jgi:type IV secretory pathway VirB3-like protein